MTTTDYPAAPPYDAPPPDQGGQWVWVPADEPPAPRRRRPRYPRALAAVLLSAVVLMVVAGVALAVDQLNQPAVRVGEPQVYASIAAETDCAALAGEFANLKTSHDAALNRGRRDLAEIDTAYMGAVIDRQQQLGC